MLMYYIEVSTSQLNGISDSGLSSRAASRCLTRKHDRCLSRMRQALQDRSLYVQCLGAVRLIHGLPPNETFLAGICMRAIVISWGCALDRASHFSMG